MTFDFRNGGWGKKMFKRSEQTKKKKICKKKNFFCHGNFTPFISKSCQIWDHFFPLLLPKDSKNLKRLDIGLWGVGAKRLLSGVRTPTPKKSWSVRQNSPKNFWNLKIYYKRKIYYNPHRHTPLPPSTCPNIQEDGDQSRSAKMQYRAVFSQGLPLYKIK